jgi:hypothetical protein
MNMSKSQLDTIWEATLQLMEEGSVSESEGHDRFSDLLISQGLDWETFSEM